MTTSASLSGARTWDNLVQWAEDLVYGGYDDWRLASMSVAAGTPTGSTGSIVNCATNPEENCRDNELGYMYRYYLPGNDGDDKTGDQTVGSVTLTGIQSAYWSGTAAPFPGNAWKFYPEYGTPGLVNKSTPLYGWAVRDGQITAAPLPGTALLIALGLPISMVLRRTRRRLW